MHSNHFLRKAIKTINFPEKLLNYLLGKNHPVFIRLLLGGLIMIGGTLVSHYHNCFAETFGGLIHATGAIPFLDMFLLIGSIEETKDKG